MHKNILIGVTGGIAAYKVVEVASRLKKSGANVRVMMTRNATEFVCAILDATGRTAQKFARPLRRQNDQRVTAVRLLEHGVR